jgi:hypothetical protein
MKQSVFEVRGVLPIFAHGPRITAEALSEPFISDDDFSAQTRDPNFSLDSSELAGIGSVALGDGEEFRPISFVMSLNPHGNLSKPEAAELFMEAYRDTATRIHDANDRFQIEKPTTFAVISQISQHAMHVAHETGYRTIASVAVMGTPERHSSALLVPKKILDEINLSVRNELVQPMVAGKGTQQPERPARPELEQTRKYIINQHPELLRFGIFAATTLLPRAEAVQEMVDLYLESGS